MNVMVDTNVVLDVLANREPYCGDAQQLFTAIDSGHIKGYLCATTLTTIQYLLRKSVSLKETEKYIRLLLRLFEVASVNRQVLEAAIESNFNDFEDAVLYEAARAAEVDLVVTRNLRDFKWADNIPVVDPPSLLAQLDG